MKIENDIIIEFYKKKKFEIYTVRNKIKSKNNCCSKSTPNKTEESDSSLNILFSYANENDFK